MLKTETNNSPKIANHSAVTYLKYVTTMFYRILMLLKIVFQSFKI